MISSFKARVGFTPKLVEFGGDYERAEMVRAFLSSNEYRGRFGN